MRMEKSRVEIDLPGFRFHPTEEELLDFYLKRMLLRNNTPFHIIPFLNIYLYDPWILPGLSKIGEREWYFFVPRDRKHGSGGRPNRTTQYGFWKATGSDRKIFSLSDPKKHLGLKKTLVFYKGRAPRGTKTDWVMNEYRLPDSSPFPKDIVLCKIYRKATSLKVLEQRAAIEEDEEEEVNNLITSTQIVDFPSPPPSMESCQVSVNDNEDFLLMLEEKLLKNEPEETDDANNNMNHVSNLELQEKTESVNSNNNNNNNNVSKVKLPEKLCELQVPKTSMDWTQDAFWTQLRSPWLDNLIFTPPYYANILNF